MPDSPRYHPLLVAGAAHFNACEFFEAHEVWEELWSEYRGPLRDFYKGLIQVAVALHHFGNGNARGAIKLYHSSRRYLAPHGPHCEGLDLEKLLDDFQRCFAELLESNDEFPEIEIDPESIPEIHFDPPPEKVGVDS